MSTKTNAGLVEYAKAQLGLPYWYGTFGNMATAELYTAKKKTYPKYYNWSGTKYDNFPSQYGKRVHDCVGLIKGYLWSDTPSSKPKYTSYQDLSANGMRSACTERGDIATMPDIPGVLVFMSGHVGVYIGNGEVIEARGHEYGVVKTKLKDRSWRWWGKCPFITYTDNNIIATVIADTTPVTSALPTKKVKIKKGNWNVRKSPSVSGKIVTQVKGENEIEVSSGWVYVPAYNGFISEKAISK